MVLHEEAHVRCLKLHRAITLHFAMREYENVEGAAYVGSLLMVKFEATKAYLKGVHALYSMRQLLIAVFDLVERMDLVLVVDGEA